METLVSAAICQHSRIRVATGRAMEFIDLTDRIEALAAEAGIRSGLVNIQSLHTTTAIVVNEHEPLLLADFDALLARAAPRDAPYRHDDMDVRTVNLAPGERPNGHAHCHARASARSRSSSSARACDEGAGRGPPSSSWRRPTGGAGIGGIGGAWRGRRLFSAFKDGGLLW